MYAPNGSGSQTLDSSSEQKQFTGPVTLLTITLSVLKKPELRDLLRNSKVDCDARMYDGMFSMRCQSDVFKLLFFFNVFHMPKSNLFALPTKR